MRFVHKNKGTCSLQVAFDLENGVLKNIQFQGGCNGSSQGIAKLAEGRDAREVAAMIRGICCGHKKTSCPDQLSEAIEEALREASSDVSNSVG